MKTYPVSVMIDGRPHSGTWTLKMGDRICVASFWGAATVDLNGERPEVAAPKVLEAIVQAYHQREADHLVAQKRELANLRRRNKRLAAALAPKPDPDVLATLRALVHQIEISEFRDELDHRLKLNKAFLDAKALVDITSPSHPRHRREPPPT